MTSDSVSPRARAKFRNWKSNFLDLSNRNPQMSFKPTSGSAIEVVHPDCSTFFKILAIMDQRGTFPKVFQPKRKARKKTKKSSQITQISPTSQTLDDSSPPSQPQISVTQQDQHQKALDRIKAKARLTEIITTLTDTVIAARIKNLIQRGNEAAEERGLNILYATLGLLKWIPDVGEPPIYSPLLFIPIKLTTKPLELDLLDDDVILNPTLKEKLVSNRIDLPPFPQEFETLTLRHYFTEIRELISREPSWELQDRVFLGAFSFSKATLYDDLDKNEEKMLQHPIIQAIAEEQGYVEPKENLPALSMLGDESDPSLRLTLLDADSSQMEAIAYAKSGTSLVIQGPPGTGKSQCIANIIGECLAAGKKVLFVAQKKAALDVVKRRLEKCGIGEFCLQIHSQNMNKKDVLHEIEKELSENQLQTTRVRKEKYQDLAFVRNELNEYIDAVTKPYGKLQMSLNELLGKLLHLDHIPDVTAEFKNPEVLTEEAFTDFRNVLNQLEPFRETLENYDTNPWRHAKLTNKLIISHEFKKELRKHLSSFRKNSLELHQQIKELQTSYPSDIEQRLSSFPLYWTQLLERLKYWTQTLDNVFPLWEQVEQDYTAIAQYFRLESLVDYKKIDFSSFQQLEMAYALHSTKKVPVHQFLITKLLEYQDRLEHFINRVKVFNLKSKLHPIGTDADLVEFQSFFSTYLPSALLLDVDGLMAKFTTDYTSWGNRHGSAFKEDKDIILACLRVPNSRANPQGHLNQIKLFKDKWGHIANSSLDFLEELVQDFQLVFEEWKNFRAIEDFLHPLFSIALIPYNISPQFWDSNIQFAQRWLDNLPHLNDWFEVQVLRWHLTDLGFLDFFNQLKNQRFYVADPDSGPNSNSGPKSVPIPYSDIFEKWFYASWLRDLYDSIPPIANFTRKFHTKSLLKFRKLDAEILFLNQSRLQRQLYDLRPKSDLKVSNDILREKGLIQRELKKKRNLRPLRHVFSEAQTLITILKPIMMMSPMAIANYLPSEKYNQFFDIVIFDEASQVTPEDAISAILRGKSLVVVGDSEQLPPTTFFTARHSDDDFDEDLDVPIQSMESLLDECTGIGFREKLLKFHYRSRKEGLIAFSNWNYYNGRLFSFPDIGVDDFKDSSSQKTVSPRPVSQDPAISPIENELDQDLGLSRLPTPSISPDTLLTLDNYHDIVKLSAIEFRWVKTGRKLKGKNKVEAQVIAQAIANHFRSNHKAGTHYSLGVVALSIVQQETIRSELDKIISTDPVLEQLILSPDYQEEPIFIKNLENVQGDERDFIFMSVGYAKDPQGGKMSLNFGPLNRSGGYRRLNVAITRARFHLKLFASFLPTDIPMSRVKARGLRDLVNYMTFARTGHLPRTISQNPSNRKLLPESIEADIKIELEKRGYTVHSFVGTSDYQVDLAVVDPKHPERYILALETDGGAYKDAKNARDRNRIRVTVMENLGWTLLHVYAPEWYKNRKKVMQRIVRTINSASKST